MEKIETKLINCPICGSKDFEVVYEKLFKVPIGNEFYFWNTEQVICKDCGMVYTNPQPTKTTLSLYYKNVYNLFGRASTGSRRSQLEFLIMNIPESINTIFEIGPFDGTFLNLAKKEGFKVFGVEPSVEGVNRAKKQYNINLDNDFFDDKYVESFVEEKQEKFDVTCFFHVLEHIQNPLNFLELVRKITKTGGYIFIEVPDAKKPNAENIADFFSIEHIMHYTENSLENIAYVLGLDIIAVEKPQDINVIRMILKNSSKEANGEILFNDFEKNKKIVKDYIQKRSKFLEIIKEKLAEVKTVIIYGAGMHTSQMIGEGLLENINIEAIVDSDVRKWRNNFFNYTISSPEILKNCKFPVLISSYDSQEEISNFISKNYPNVKQIKLYDKVISYNKGTKESVC